MTVAVIFGGSCRQAVSHGDLSHADGYDRNETDEINNLKLINM